MEKFRDLYKHWNKEANLNNLKRALFVTFIFLAGSAVKLEAQSDRVVYTPMKPTPTSSMTNEINDKPIQYSGAKTSPINDAVERARANPQSVLDADKQMERTFREKRAKQRLKIKNEEELKFFDRETEVLLNEFRGGSPAYEVLPSEEEEDAITGKSKS